MKIIFSNVFPKTLDKDTLYVSQRYNTTTHLCACGCKTKVVLPLGKGSWELEDSSRPTLRPSVHVQTCNSHYWIRDGSIKWERKFSIEEAKKYSQADQEKYIREFSEKGLFTRIISHIKRFFKI